MVRFSVPVQTSPGAHPTSYTMGTGSFPGVNRPRRDVDHTPPSSAEVNERVQLYLYSTSGPSWPFFIVVVVVIAAVVVVLQIQRHAVWPLNRLQRPPSGTLVSWAQSKSLLKLQIESCVVPVHAMHTYRWRGRIPPLIFNVGLKFHPPAALPRGKSRGNIILIHVRGWKRKISRLFRKSIPASSSLLPSAYWQNIIPAPLLLLVFVCELSGSCDLYSLWIVKEAGVVANLAGCKIGD
jgi:hypothetical protein